MRFPCFVDDLPLTRRALEFAAARHGGQERDADHAPFILHPLEVAAPAARPRLPGRGRGGGGAARHRRGRPGHRRGASRRTSASGSRGSSARVTEPEREGPYRERKAALRAAVEAAEDDALVIYAADKVAKARELRMTLAAGDGAPRRRSSSTTRRAWRCSSAGCRATRSCASCASSSRRSSSCRRGAVDRTFTPRLPFGHTTPRFAGQSAGHDREGRPPLPLHRIADLQARRPARARPARVRHAARGGLRARQAARDGLRDDHRSRHDRRRPARSPTGPDVFVSEELTARFAGEPQAVHVLCLGITPDDHARLQELAGDVEAVAEYLHGNEIACALAHPFYKVAAPLAAAPPPPARRAVRGLGGPQRRPRARAQPARLDLHGDPRRHRRRRLRRPRRRRHRAHLDADARRRHAGGVPRARPRRAARSPAATRARRPSGRTPRWRSPSARSAAASATPRPTRPRCCGWPSA